MKRKPMALIKKLRKKKECPPNEKPDVVKTHLRDMVVVPEMTGSMVGVYNGKTFNQVEIKVRLLGVLCRCRPRPCGQFFKVTYLDAG
jgi:small subunit ribosomal protein S15e